MAYKVGEIAKIINGKVSGNAELVIKGVNSLELAKPDELSFVSSAKHFKNGESSRAGCVVAPAIFSSSAKAIITSDNPKAAFAKAMWLFHPQIVPGGGIDKSASIDPSASLGSNVSVGPNVSIGKNSKIGDGTSIGPCVVIGEGVVVGGNSVIYPNVTIYDRTQIGSHVIIHAGVVIGADGFGFVFVDGHHLKVPQLGNVIIEDDVEIGANCTIDRATFGSTMIRRGTKMDNLVHVAHNVVVGEHSLLIAQVGIAGSSKIGSYVTLAGQVGVADNASIGDKAIVGGKTAVITGQKIKPGEVVWGIPARPIEETKSQMAAMSLLPKFRARLRKLEERISELEESLRASKI